MEEVKHLCDTCPAEAGDCICSDDPCDECPKTLDARVLMVTGIL